MHPTDDEKELLKQMLALLADEKAPVISNKKLTAFLPLTGKDYKAELMVVGRSVNGWTIKNKEEGFDQHECFNAEKLDSIIASVVETSVADDGVCPLAWVNNNWHKRPDIDYSTSRSAFWRGIKGVVEGLGVSPIDFPTWASRLAWSNLYKISSLKAGNPSTKLAEYIKPLCVNLLESEIKFRRPQKILYLTGLNWAEPFLGKEKLNYLSENSYAEAFYTTRTGLVGVVAKHPQGKPNRLWVDEVVRAFGYVASFNSSSK